jgi:hypothetical protein
MATRPEPMETPMTKKLLPHQRKDYKGPALVPTTGIAVTSEPTGQLSLVGADIDLAGFVPMDTTYVDAPALPALAPTTTPSARPAMKCRTCHQLFTVWRADEVAECLKGMTDDLYAKLWSFVPASKDDKVNFGKWGDSLRRDWRKLSCDDQGILNDLAKAHVAEQEEGVRALA